MAAIKCLVNRLLTYLMCETNKKREYNTIKQIFLNNKYDVKILDKIILTNDAKTKNGKKG